MIIRLAKLYFQYIELNIKLEEKLRAFKIKNYVQFLSLNCTNLSRKKFFLDKFSISTKTNKFLITYLKFLLFQKIKFRS